MSERHTVRNKADSSIADCGFRPALRWDTPCGPPGQGPVVQTNPIGRSQSCETNPILQEPSAVRRGLATLNRPNSGLGGPLSAARHVRNKANFRSPDRADRPGIRHRMPAAPVAMQGSILRWNCSGEGRYIRGLGGRRCRRAKAIEEMSDKALGIQCVLGNNLLVSAWRRSGSFGSGNPFAQANRTPEGVADAFRP